MASCTLCRGSGKQTIDCHKCDGDGRCTNGRCQSGTIRVPRVDGPSQSRRCPICKGNSRCPNCRGSERVGKRCGRCQGRGGKLSLDRANGLYLSRIQVALDSLAAEHAKQAQAVAAAKTRASWRPRQTGWARVPLHSSAPMATHARRRA